MTEHFIYEPLARKLFTAFATQLQFKKADKLLSSEEFAKAPPVTWDDISPAQQEAWRVVAKTADTQLKQDAADEYMRNTLS